MHPLKDAAVGAKSQTRSHLTGASDTSRLFFGHDALEIHISFFVKPVFAVGGCAISVRRLSGSFALAKAREVFILFLFYIFFLKFHFIFRKWLVGGVGRSSGFRRLPLCARCERGVTYFG